MGMDCIMICEVDILLSAYYMFQEELSSGIINVKRLD
jgi:hypothetical protein